MVRSRFTLWAWVRGFKPCGGCTLRRWEMLACLLEAVLNALQVATLGAWATAKGKIHPFCLLINFPLSAEVRASPPAHAPPRWLEWSSSQWCPGKEKSQTHQEPQASNQTWLCKALKNWAELPAYPDRSILGVGVPGPGGRHWRDLKSRLYEAPPEKWNHRLVRPGWEQVCENQHPGTRSNNVVFSLHAINQRTNLSLSGEISHWEGDKLPSSPWQLLGNHSRPETNL